MHQATITGITLHIQFLIEGCPHVIVESGLFLPTSDSHAAITPLLLPPKERLLSLFERLQQSCKSLDFLEIHLTGGFMQIQHGDDRDLDLLHFRLWLNPDDKARPYSASGTSQTQPIDRDLALTGTKQKVEYSLSQGNVDRLSQMVTDRIAELEPHTDGDDDRNREGGLLDQDASEDGTDAGGTDEDATDDAGSVEGEEDTDNENDGTH